MFSTFDTPEEGNRRPMVRVVLWAIGIVVVAIVVVWALM